MLRAAVLLISELHLETARRNIGVFSFFAAIFFIIIANTENEKMTNDQERGTQ